MHHSYVNVFISSTYFSDSILDPSALPPPLFQLARRRADQNSAGGGGRLFLAVAVEFGATS